MKNKNPNRKKIDDAEEILAAAMLRTAFTIFGIQIEVVPEEPVQEKPIEIIDIPYEDVTEQKQIQP